MERRNNMTDAERLIGRYLDGELDRRGEAELRRRLSADAELAEELRRYVTLDEQVEALAETGPDGVDYDAQRSAVFSALERKVLLHGPPRRRMVLRMPPAVRVMAAAAVLLIVASAAVWLWRGPAETPTPAARVSVAMLSETPRALGEPELTVRVLRPADGVAGATQHQLALGLPGGTVMASVGTALPAEAGGAMPWPVEWLGVE